MTTKSNNTKPICNLFTLALATMALGSAACTAPMSTDEIDDSSGSFSGSGLEISSGDPELIDSGFSVPESPSGPSGPSGPPNPPSSGGLECDFETVDAACSDPSAGEQPEGLAITEDSSCVTLYAGQDIPAGEVCVRIDKSLDTSEECREGTTGVLLVELSTRDGWELMRAHLAVGDELSDIPTNSAGNPQIGSFDYKSGVIDGAKSFTFSVPLCALNLDGSLVECEPVEVFLAAHADVRKDKGDGGGYQYETGWAEGTPFVEKGSWGEHFEMELACTPELPPCPEQCETAYAFGGEEHAICFTDIVGADVSSERWGWSNGPLSPGSYSWGVYAGAGQCDLSKGTLVGWLTVEYDGSEALVAFERVGDAILVEEHLYIGNEPLPLGKDGKLTTAPGQFPHTIELTGAKATCQVIDNLKGDIFVSFHAVACGTSTMDRGGD